MKIANFEITKKNIMIAAGACALILLLIPYIIFYAPLLKKLKTGYTECKNLETQVVNAHDIIKTSGETYDDRTLITEKEISVAIEELTKHGKAMGIDFMAMAPKEIIENPAVQYKILPIEMKIKSNIEAFSNFLGFLDELKKSVIKVKSLDIKRVDGSRSEVTGTIVIDMYLSARG